MAIVLPGWTVNTNRGPWCLYEYTKFPQSANRGQKHECVVKSKNISKLLIMQSSCASSRKAATLLRFLKHDAGCRRETVNTDDPSVTVVHA